ncbi:MAG: hypothetical protein NVS2B16_14320 [Chloroflexota bacterium]
MVWRTSGIDAMRPEVRCRSITLAEARVLPPIRSGFVTSRVMRLRRWSHENEFHWALSEVEVAPPFEKVYDDGELDEWLSLYEEAAPAESVRFIAAYGREPLGLLTWRRLHWNDTIWLVDIRVQPSVRRSGIGGALIRALQQEAASSGARGISVETQINNVPALRFYRLHGFTISGFDDALYSNRDLESQDVAVFLFWARDGVTDEGGDAGPT